MGLHVPSNSTKYWIEGSLAVILIVLLGMLYYVKHFYIFFDVLVSSVVIYLAMDSFSYARFSRRYNYNYNVLGGLLFVPGIVHIIRLYSDLHLCNSMGFVVYNWAAMLIGLAILYHSYYLIKMKSGSLASHILGIIVGSVMIIGHIIRLYIGGCF